jgi:hypothetical protein
MRPENSAAGRELGTHQTQTQLSEITTVTPHPEQQITVPRVQLNVYHVTLCTVVVARPARRLCLMLRAGGLCYEPFRGEKESKIWF